MAGPLRPAPGWPLLLGILLIPLLPLAAGLTSGTGKPGQAPALGGDFGSVRLDADRALALATGSWSGMLFSHTSRHEQIEIRWLPPGGNEPGGMEAGPDRRLVPDRRFILDPPGVKGGLFREGDHLCLAPDPGQEAAYRPGILFRTGMICGDLWGPEAERAATGSAPGAAATDIRDRIEDEPSGGYAGADIPPFYSFHSRTDNPRLEGAVRVFKFQLQ